MPLPHEPVQMPGPMLEDGTKTDPKLEDAVAASTVPIAAFQLSGRYCRENVFVRTFLLL